jgi:hypothetical protein
LDVGGGTKEKRSRILGFSLRLCAFGGECFNRPKDQKDKERISRKGANVKRKRQEEKA